MTNIISPLRKTLLAASIALCLSSNLSAAETPEAGANKPLPLQEIRQFTDVYAAVKAFYVDEKQTGDRQLLENALAGFETERAFLMGLQLGISMGRLNLLPEK